MRRCLPLLSAVALLFWPRGDSRAGQGSSAAPDDSAGWTTNGPAVYGLRVTGYQNYPGPPVTFRPIPTEIPLDIRQTMLAFRPAMNQIVIVNRAKAFDHFLPESLNNLIYTNFIAHTNGRNMVIWTMRQHPAGWPARPPEVQWNTASLLWGMRGFTGLSPCWESEGNPGQVPITALTRRHGYARGHDMGPDGIGTLAAGRKVWFLTAQNTVVETTVKREVVRTRETSGRDYTIFLFSSDLPESIQPLRVVDATQVFSVPRCRYIPGGVGPIFKTEQTGYVSADVPGFTVETFKGGDSGSPNMLPFPGELVFCEGRSTSGASKEMQADMDKLCQLEGLNPARYQLQWVDVSKYPSYLP